MKNCAPMKTTANDSWTAKTGSSPTSPIRPVSRAWVEYIRTRTVRIVSRTTPRPRFLPRKYVVPEKNPRTRLTVDPPSAGAEWRSATSGPSPEVRDLPVVEMDHEVERECIALAVVAGDQDLGRRIRPDRVGRHRPGAEDPDDPVHRQLAGEE